MKDYCEIKKKQLRFLKKNSVPCPMSQLPCDFWDWESPSNFHLTKKKYKSTKGLIKHLM